MRRAVATLTTLVVLTGACSRGGGAPPRPTSRAPTSGQHQQRQTNVGPLDPNEVSKSLPSRLKVTVRGDVSLAYDATVNLRVVTINKPEVTELRFLSVGIEDVKKLSDGRAFRIAFDLVGDWRGRGRYALPAVGRATVASVDPNTPDPNAAGRTLSRVYLTYFPLGDPASSAEAAKAGVSFENVLEACAVRVDDGGARSGKLDCPKVADAKGQTVSIAMEWSKP